MKQILVPTDFSVPATHAVDLATRIAVQQGCPVHLVHSIDVPDTWQQGHFSSASLATKPQREQHALYPEVRERVGHARQSLEDIVKRMARKKVDGTYELAPNSAWQDIVRLAQSRKADLIVMGTRGAGALKEAFIGSNTQRVVRMAPMPVLTLHSAAPTKVANIAVCVDPLASGWKKILPKLLDPVQGERTRIHLVYVNTANRFMDTDSALEQLRNISKHLDPSVLVHVCDHYSVAEGVIAFARREGMDMIAMPTHGRTGLQGFMNSSVAETVVNHAPVPVITLRID
jgi:nucleotide-binding universal stress UspA family protein